MSKRDRPGGGSPPTKKSKEKSGEVSISCVKCKEVAEEDSIECECCFKWEHRECAGISEDEYKILGDASTNIMFFCSVCRPNVTLALKFFNEIQEKQKLLDDKVKQLEEKLNSITSVQERRASGPDATSAAMDTNLSTPIDTVTIQNVPALPKPRPKPSSIISDKRYNVILYGIEESPANTYRADRQKYDLGKILNIMSDIDSSITSASIKDFYRLGKFNHGNNHRPRPILIKFLRAFDATLVLNSNKKSLSSGISIKPDLTIDERKIENILLKERRRLIDNGTERKHIRIRGNCLYLNNKLHGAVKNFELHLEHSGTTSSTASALPNDPHSIAQSIPSSSDASKNSQ